MYGYSRQTGLPDTVPSGGWAAFIFCGLFALFLSNGAWLLVGGLVGLLALALLMMSGTRAVACLWIIGSPTVFLFANNFLQVIPFVTVERLFFILILFMMFFNKVVLKSSVVPLNGYEKLLIAFLGLMFLSLCYRKMTGLAGSEFRKDIAFFANYAMPLTAFYIARRLDWSESAYKNLITALLVVGVFLGITAFLQQFLGITTFVPEFMEVIHSESRATGTFSNASEYGLVTSSLFVFGTLLFVNTKDPLIKCLIFLSLLVVIAGVFLSKTRATWLGLAVSVFVLYIADKRVRPYVNASVISGAISAAIVVPIFFDIGNMVNDFYARATEMGPILNRFALWVGGINMLIQNPFLGIGFGVGAFSQTFADYALSIGFIQSQWAIGVGLPHNEFIHMYALTGIFGGTLYILIFKRALNALKQLTLHPDTPVFIKDAALYTKAIVIGYIANAFFVDLGKFNYITLLMFFMLGALLKLGASGTKATAYSETDKP